MVVLPAPFSPTRAICSPGLIVKFRLSRIFSFIFERYANETFLNSISGILSLLSLTESDLVSIWGLES